MADELGPAFAMLQQKLAEQLRGVADTKKAINLLLKVSGQNPLYTDEDEEASGSIRADQFYGKGLATSAAEYLQTRKQACQPDEILRALVAGGFDFDMLDWKENDRLRLLSLSLAKNTGPHGKFHRLKNGSFGLRAWYDEEFLQKAALGAEAVAKAKKKKMAAKNATKAQASVTPAPTVKATAKPHVVATGGKTSAKPSSSEAEQGTQKEEAATG